MKKLQISLLLAGLLALAGCMSPGPGGAKPTPEANRSGPTPDYNDPKQCWQRWDLRRASDDQPLANKPYKVFNEAGQVVDSGVTDKDGITQPVRCDPKGGKLEARTYW